MKAVTKVGRMHHLIKLKKRKKMGRKILSLCDTLALPSYWKSDPSEENRIPEISLEI